MMWKSAIAVTVGAAVGALLRWWLSLTKAQCTLPRDSTRHVGRQPDWRLCDRCRHRLFRRLPGLIAGVALTHRDRLLWGADDVLHVLRGISQPAPRGTDSLGFRGASRPRHRVTAHDVRGHEDSESAHGLRRAAAPQIAVKARMRITSLTVQAVAGPAERKRPALWPASR